ncbi:hypothetical protein C4D60_Mb11t18570 [Musa balbisiana]|uniref:Uncharacterized protein n=1 Tax=Musa balbisiana TaxID=52838 RepID=A0A4S8J5A0_MUSBA|nr:hypothetical protein C4D60_Mb11t18570 [Musa balbisiana]
MAPPSYLRGRSVCSDSSNISGGGESEAGRLLRTSISRATVIRIEQTSREIETLTPILDESMKP